MNNNQTLDSQPDKPSEKTLTWAALSFRVFIVYVIFAIASHIYFPTPTYNLASSQILIFSILAYLINYMAIYIPITLVAVLIAKVPANNRQKPLQNFLNGALIATAIIATLMIYGGWYATNVPANTSTERSHTIKNTETPSSSIKPVIVATTTQTSEGVTNADLDQAALKNLETWMVNMFLQKGKNNYEVMGYNPEDFNPKLDAKSVYVTSGTKKLAIIKINLDNSMRSVTIIGIEGKELYRVTCIRASNHEIPVFSGECGNEIYKTFAVRIQP